MVATAAVEGLITNRIGGETWGRKWHITPLGLALLLYIREKR